jgi:N-acyl homoserine lactone hydrolase
LSVKIYFFECGTLKSQKHLFTLNKDIGKSFEVPVPFFLIQYKNKNILFDTGNALQVSKNPEVHWGEVTNTYYPVMEEQQYVLNQLKQLKIQPENIDYVIFSHLHLDHAGAVGCFPNAIYIVHKKELQWAFSPECTQKSAYIKADINKNINWLALQNEFNQAYDLFNDEQIKIYPTFGHTPGHISILIKLQNLKSFFLTSDSCYTEENLDYNIPPGLVWDFKESMKTINWIKELKKSGVEIIVGHDPISWKKFKLAPEYYE